jgi:hypothetical protein
MYTEFCVENLNKRDSLEGRGRQKGNIKVTIKGTEHESVTGLILFQMELIMGSFEHNTEPNGYIKLLTS